MYSGKAILYWLTAFDIDFSNHTSKDTLKEGGLK